MASASTKRQDVFLEQSYTFRRNAVLIITKMLELSSRTHSPLVDEVLHSILFLGRINALCVLPADIFAADLSLMNQLKGSYPRPFQYFETKLPTRSPVSCLMDLIVEKTGQQKESEILNSLHDFIRDLRGHPRQLVASTACVSQPNKDKNSTRYYGLSMSTSENRIVIAAACLKNWDEYVAGAVMTYYPNGQKKPYFDGTIKLPGQVRCQAFSLSNLVSIPPCKSCASLFGFPESGTNLWTHGNCAENESISKMLKHEKQVKEQAKPTSPTCTEANKRKAKQQVSEALKKLLDNLTHKIQWDDTYYSPI